MSEVAPLPPTSAVAPTPSALTDTPPPPTPIPENSRQFPIPEKNSAQPPPPPPPLTPRQQAALAHLLAGVPIGHIARALQIDPKTLYNWRRHNPTFVAELTRRQHDLWLDIADDLRTTVAASVDTLRGHLADRSPMTQLRAARLLINLVNAPHLAPPTPPAPDDAPDEMLCDADPPPSTPELEAQRRALLDQLLGNADV